MSESAKRVCKPWQGIHPDLVCRSNGNSRHDEYSVEQKIEVVYSGHQHPDLSRDQNFDEVKGIDDGENGSNITVKDLSDWR